MTPRPDDDTPAPEAVPDAADAADVPAGAGDSATRPVPPPAADLAGDALAAARADQWRWLIPPGDVRDARVLGVPNGDYAPRNFCGYFRGDRLPDLATTIAGRGAAAGVYVTLNPARPDLVARANHRLAALKTGGATKDTEVVARHWLLVDVDPVRPKGVSATAAEKAAARAALDAVRAHLAGLGWPGSAGRPGCWPTAGTASTCSSGSTCRPTTGASWSESCGPWPPGSTRPRRRSTGPSPTRRGWPSCR